MPNQNSLQVLLETLHRCAHVPAPAGHLPRSPSSPSPASAMCLCPSVGWQIVHSNNFSCHGFMPGAAVEQHVRSRCNVTGLSSVFAEKTIRPSLVRDACCAVQGGWERGGERDGRSCAGVVSRALLGVASTAARAPTGPPLLPRPSPPGRITKHSHLAADGGGKTVTLQALVGSRRVDGVCTKSSIPEMDTKQRCRCMVLSRMTWVSTVTSYRM